jgi:ribosomal protein S20
MKLTKEQEARFPEFVDKWVKIGLSTEPSNREKSEKAIRGLYGLAKLKEPKVIWLPCPLSAAMSAVAYATIRAKQSIHKNQKNISVDSAVYSAMRSAVDSAVYSAVDSAVVSAVYSAVDSAVDSTVYSAVVRAVDSTVYSAVVRAVDSTVLSAVVSDVVRAVDSAVVRAVDSAVGSDVRSAGMAYFGGSVWNASYSAWADYFNEVLSISIDRNFLDMTDSCGFYWTLDDVCFASERPSKINLDDQGRLHCEDGLSIQYPSGWGLFHWHGTQVPGEWIMDRNSLNAEKALTWKNIEQRRSACEILTWAKVLDELKAKVIDADEDEEIGELVEVEIPDIGKERFLRVICGTGRKFAIPVPPNMKTALAANAWTYGIEGDTLKQLEVRT